MRGTGPRVALTCLELRAYASAARRAAGRAFQGRDAADARSAASQAPP
jgi:hypothetical protein